MRYNADIENQLRNAISTLKETLDLLQADLDRDDKQNQYIHLLHGQLDQVFFILHSSKKLSTNQETG